MTTGSEQRAEITPNLLNGRLARIEKVPGKYSGYILHLDSGTRISLPPEGILTINKIHLGDKFEFSPREDIVKEELKRFDDQTRISVKGTNLSSHDFITTNDCINSLS